MPMDRPDTPNAAAAAGRQAHPERWLRVWSHREDLLRVARRRSMTPEDAEDAVHEAMLRAAERPGLDDERLGGWLTTVTMRLCVDRHRQVTREAEVHRSPTLTVPGPVPVEEAACDRDEARWLAARSAQLPERQAEALRLKSEGLDVGEVALRMRLGYRTVESLLARARRTLRTTLAGTLGLAVFLWGRGKLLASSPVQAVAVSSATAGLVVTGFVLPYAAEPSAPRTSAEPRAVTVLTGSGRDASGGGEVGAEVTRARVAQGAGRRGPAPAAPVRPGVVGGASASERAPLAVALPRLTVRLPPVSVAPRLRLGITPPTPRGSAPDPAAQSPQGLDLPTRRAQRLELPSRRAQRLDVPTRRPQPEARSKKSGSGATGVPRLPAEQVSEVRQHGRRGTGWVPRSVGKDLPSPSDGTWSGEMFR
ncbi:sigma-70 family RNA polymerase sigma factor [Streptomyces sp. NPDC102360]|uniref:sigma-70 family RNA polymerase sigma factor n=1 Tax=Streptomyces sp. NPDC102360 TaxID=3366160 RepID=UPI00381CB32E